MAAADGLFIACQVDPEAMNMEAEFGLLAEMIIDVAEKELLLVDSPTDGRAY